MSKKLFAVMLSVPRIRLTVQGSLLIEESIFVSLFFSYRFLTRTCSSENQKLAFICRVRSFFNVRCATRMLKIYIRSNFTAVIIQPFQHSSRRRILTVQYTVIIIIAII